MNRAQSYRYCIALADTVVGAREGAVIARVPRDRPGASPDATYTL